MNAKNFGVVAFLSVLVIGIVLVCGCAQNGGEQPPVTGSGDKAASVECIAGTSKTVVGREYVRTGVESHVIQGKSLDLCCWEIDGQDGRKSKICCDSSLSPVGYANGILWEADKSGGEFHETMERYVEGGKSCQEFFTLNGSTESKHCD